MQNCRFMKSRLYLRRDFLASYSGLASATAQVLTSASAHCCARAASSGPPSGQGHGPWCRACVSDSPGTGNFRRSPGRCGLYRRYYQWRAVTRAERQRSRHIRRRNRSSTILTFFGNSSRPQCCRVLQTVSSFPRPPQPGPDPLYRGV